MRDTATAYDAYGDAVSWGISGSALGSPGAAKTARAQAYRGWDNFHFTEAQRGDDLISGPFTDTDRDGRVNWVEYALGSDPWVADAYPVGVTWIGGVTNRLAKLNFRRPVNALDVKYELMATGDLANELWSVVGDAVLETSPLTNDLESVTLREANPSKASARFYRLRLTFEGN